MAVEEGDRRTGGATRAGYVALVGRPNVGKSTLLNAFTGERLSIVTPRAQTTRERVMGIYTGPRAQIIFVDTPGLLEPRYLLQRSILEAATAAFEESDLVLLLLDATRPAATPPDGPVLAALERRRDVLHVAVNKIDAAPRDAVDRLARWAEDRLGRAAFRVAAATGAGVVALRDALAAALPNSPFLYPEDDIAVQPVRFFASELIRETIFEEYHEEVPYSTAVRIEEFRERARPIYIRAAVFVERATQKSILVGRQGSGIRRLGERSREKIEALLDAPVYLDLWVKVLPGWRKRRATLRRLGYPVSLRATERETRDG